ncbi:hypothetical protein ENSA5_08210 [Enhygromyxa salina]|uniref:Uncharacterized protein n=1 Tax=Enhygromyxa salina TaxID=215803 RepID=A0A2S9YH65_9BACT|nr:hypothetical protein [Enhygromyxa salina]PRQ04372.1 hypothetical protein ENSA5_08210 [Enhygromyxa salina]
MPPLVLALIDSVFALALHHDRRVESAAVRAQVTGPETALPTPHGLAIRVSVTQPREGEPSEGEPSEESVGFHVDLDGGRLLAMELNLAELPLDRSGLARLIGELESWCYARIPMAQEAD